jgi:AcrR family transcriptional regulator
MKAGAEKATKRGICRIMKRKNIASEVFKEYIAESLLLLMKKKSYSRISIGEITDKAGVNRSTYYRHFSSKEEIIKFYFKRILHGYSLVFNRNDTYKTHLQKLFQHYLVYKQEFLLIYKNGLAHVILDALNDFFEPIANNETGKVQKRLRIYWYAGATYNLFLYWLEGGMKETPEELGGIAAELLPTAAEQDILKTPFLLDKR